MSWNCLRLMRMCFRLSRAWRTRCVNCIWLRERIQIGRKRSTHKPWDPSSANSYFMEDMLIYRVHVYIAQWRARHNVTNSIKVQVFMYYEYCTLLKELGFGLRGFTYNRQTYFCMAHTYVPPIHEEFYRFFMRTKCTMSRSSRSYCTQNMDWYTVIRYVNQYALCGLVVCGWRDGC